MLGGFITAYCRSSLAQDESDQISAFHLLDPKRRLFISAGRLIARGCARLLFALRCSQHEARSFYKCSLSVSAHHSRSIHWFQIPINLLIRAHSTQQRQGQSLWLSVSHAVAETAPAAKDDFCTVQERRCRAPLTLSSDFFPSHFLTK